MLTLGEQFKAIRKQRGLTQDAFHQICDRRTLGKFEKNQQMLETGRLIKCLEFMNTSFGEFMAMRNFPDTNLVYSIPVYAWEDMSEGDRTPVDRVLFEQGASTKAYALEVKDRSMISEKSAFPVGSFIIVEPAKNAENDDLVIVRKKDQCHFRRIRDEWRTPDNFAFESVKGGRIIGRVIGAIWSVKF